MNLIIICLLSLYCCSLMAEEPPVCHRCQVIREENKKKTNPYEYYEDYLKDHPEEEQIQEKQDN